MDLNRYQESREAVIYGNQADVFQARETAYDWHGGQWSALYSFASTDATVWSEGHRDDLLSEVENCRMSLLAREGEDTADDLDALDNLTATIKALPAKQAA